MTGHSVLADFVNTTGETKKERKREREERKEGGRERARQRERKKYDKYNPNESLPPSGPTSQQHI